MVCARMLNCILFAVLVCLWFIRMLLNSLDPKCLLG